MTRLLSEKQINGTFLVAFKSEIENLNSKVKQISTYSQRLFSNYQASLNTTARLSTNQPVTKGLKVSTLRLKEAGLRYF
jgi:hypothetical protein